MIEFKNIKKEAPYILFKEKYNQSINAHQKSIEAACISSYSKNNKEVNARFVNIKAIHNDNFIFFSNYNSSKAKDFESHSQVTALFYWNSINLQIRIKANIFKTSKEFNIEYFKKRDKKKNALAISSSQSQRIVSYKEVLSNYDKTIKKNNLIKCPEYWGGYKFIPYYFEFWEGHDSRINKRDVYELNKEEWTHYLLQP